MQVAVIREMDGKKSQHSSNIGITGACGIGSGRFRVVLPVVVVLIEFHLWY